MGLFQALVYGLPIFFSIPVAVSYIGLMKQWLEIPRHAIWARLAAAVYILLSLYFSVQMCLGMSGFVSELFSKDGGPGPIALLALPFFTVAALVPVAIGMAALTLMGKKLGSRR